MPPTRPASRPGTLPSDHALGSFFASVGKYSIKPATPSIKRNINDWSMRFRLVVTGLVRKYGLSWERTTKTATPLRNPTRTGCGVNLMTFATPATPKAACHKPPSATHKKTATTIRCLSFATPGLFDSEMIRPASSRDSLTRGDVVTNEEVATSAETAPATIPPQSPAAAPIAA